MSKKAKIARTGGRAGNARRGGPAINQMSWRDNILIDKPTEPIDQEAVQKIHEAAMEILEEIGIEMLNPKACEILKKHGGK